MKLIRVFSIFVLLLLVVGCKKDQYMICDISLNNETQNYELTAQYKVYYKKNYVTKIEKHEIYKSSDKKVVNYFNELNSLQYYDLSDKYKGVIYDIKAIEQGVEINSSINLKKFDIKRYVKDGRIYNKYVKGKKLLLSGLKKIYEAKGAICK